MGKLLRDANEPESESKTAIIRSNKVRSKNHFDEGNKIKHRSNESHNVNAICHNALQKKQPRIQIEKAYKVSIKCSISPGMTGDR
jgi:hypothetical protein